MHTPVCSIRIGFVCIGAAIQFGCIAFTLNLMTSGEVAAAEQSRSNQAVAVRVLPDGKYLYKGKEITARELIRIGEHEEINLIISKDQIGKDPLFKQVQEHAKRNGSVTHIGFIGIHAKQNDPK